MKPSFVFGSLAGLLGCLISCSGSGTGSVDTRQDAGEGSGDAAGNDSVDAATGDDLPDGGTGSPFGPLADDNPSVGEGGAVTMHCDTASSDATAKSGPGAGPFSTSYKAMFGACSTVLIRSDGYPMVLCTAWLGRDPTIRILDPQSASGLATLKLPAGSLLGGVYAYLDDQDRLVMVDGEQNLIRIRAQLGPSSSWELTIDESVPLASSVTGHCGGGGCDAVVSISPDGDGAVWFATQAAVVGIYDPESETLSDVVLADDEMIHNSFSTTRDGRAAIVTDHALYLIDKDESGAPVVRWRRQYDRGSARKPGQLSHGTGATPTFFGPTDGTDYVTITDNADDRISLLVYHADADSEEQGGTGGRRICQHELFDDDASGTENSAIAIGRLIFVASTYGYPYPAVPEGAGPAVPEEADFAGGMVRIDVRSDASGCDLIWQNQVRSSAVPKLSVADELIYTVERQRSAVGVLDSYHFTVVDPHTGEILAQVPVGSTTLRDTLQMAGNIGDGQVYWQGTLGGIARIAPQ